ITLSDLHTVLFEEKLVRAYQGLEKTIYKILSMLNSHHVAEATKAAITHRLYSEILDQATKQGISKGRMESPDADVGVIARVVSAEVDREGLIRRKAMDKKEIDTSLDELRGV